MKISDIDPNLKITTGINEKNITFFDPTKAPFSLHGVIPPDAELDAYHRIPRALAEATNDGVAWLYRNTAGGRIRFRTDSPYAAIKVRYPRMCVMNHMALCGIQGFSLYRVIDGRERYVGSFIPTGATEYENVLYLPRELSDYVLYMPLYNDVGEILIGLDRGSQIEPPAPYRQPVPVVYYGSSITQGGCASRPGNDYQGFVSRELGCDYINLGFSGSAKGETCMAEYIAGLSMSAFVLDYDHNAPDPEHLEKTHEAFFKIVREKNPDLPIVIVSRPQQYLGEDGKRRRAIIRATYERALAAGDGNVYFLDGSTFFEDLPSDDATVDGCHPTDLGFYFMAKKIGEVLRGVV